MTCADPDPAAAAREGTAEHDELRFEKGLLSPDQLGYATCVVHGALIVLGLALAGACSASGDACPSGQAPLTVVSTEVAAHYVRLDLQYSGGCAEHDFAVWWPDGIVAASAPPQVQLHLQHYDRGDACDALVARSIWVDLSPLHEVQLGTDRFLIHLRGHPGTIDYTFAAAAPPPSEDVVAIDQSCGSQSSR